MTDSNDGPRNTWEFDTPDSGLIRGDRPTGKITDRSTSDDAERPPTVSPAPTESRRQVSRRNAYVLWSGIAVAAIVAIIVVALSVGGGDDQPVVEVALVPELIDLQQEVAVSEIEARGLTVGTITSQDAEDVEPGLVLDQRPTAGAEIEPGAPVDLVVAAGSTTLEVPDVVAMVEADAVAALDDAGFEAVTVEPVAGDDTPGTVIGQRPEAGSTVEPDTEIVLSVSTGPPLERVPDLAGLAAAEAVAVLEEIGWEVSTSDEPDVAVPVGDVVRTEPAARAEVQLGETIVLIVSSGPPVVEVPDVLGENALTASQQLRDLGLETSTDVCTVRNADRYPAGTVRRQSPDAGTEVEVGTTVELCIAVVPPTPTPAPPTPTAVPQPPPRQDPPTPPPPPPEDPNECSDPSDRNCG